MTYSKNKRFGITLTIKFWLDVIECTLMKKKVKILNVNRSYVIM